MPEFKEVNSAEEARQLASEFLQANKTLRGGNAYMLPDGTKLRVRKKEGGRLSSENWDTKTKSDAKRTTATQSKTEAEAAYERSTKRAARQRSESTEHQYVSEGKPSIAEHNVRVASGGTNEYMSISDPYFKIFKDTIEAKLPDNLVADIDDITGGVRIIDKKYHNKFQPTSEQPGITLEPGMDIDAEIAEFSAKRKNSLLSKLNLTPSQRRQLDMTNVDGKAALLSKFKQQALSSLNTINTVDMMAQMQEAEPGQVFEESAKTTKKQEKMAEMAREKGGLFGMPDLGISEQWFGKSMVQDERQKYAR